MNDTSVTVVTLPSAPVDSIMDMRRGLAVFTRKRKKKEKKERKKKEKKWRLEWKVST